MLLYILCHLEYFTAIGHTLWAFGNIVAIWYIFPSFSVLYQEKFGNPALLANKRQLLKLVISNMYLGQNKSQSSQQRQL
jgi:hypothetical protein